ncbi:MAG: hypothetical protein HRF51_01115 [bacterium]
MSKRKNLLAAALLSFYLLASVFQILCGYESAVSNSLVEARYPYSLIYLRAKQFDDRGNFLGCWGTGYDCLVIPFGQNSMTVSTEGLGTQPAQMLDSK